jgi:hypothetical protein
MNAEIADGRGRELRSLRCFERSESGRFAPDAPSARVCNSVTPAIWSRTVGPLAFPSAGVDKRALA